ncbi:MAG: mandelate racemase/muconate lactonizing enzyme family protein [Planctomycetes bacterium]|nr:mandelate racemase/muconate lactonizing enzyme family protein [Planctomycetota bacterium]
MRIDRVELRVVAPKVPRYTWSHDLPEQYMTNTLVRVYTDAGVEGIGGVTNYTSYDYDRYTAETLRHLIPILVGRNPLQREALWRDLQPRAFPLAPGAIAAIDIALWDLLGKVANLPVYQLLGGTRDRIPAYASTPLLPDVPSYLRLVDELVQQGFRAIKFHAWCIPDKDLELAREVRKHHPGHEIAFMHDAENHYDRGSALRVAAELESLGFTWFEAPLPDYDLDGYRELTSRVNIPVLPSGNWFQDLASFSAALRSKAWRVARTDVTICGGITPARKAMILAEAAGMNCEVMCWGYTLISTANLQLMLAFPNATYYEQPVPYEAYEYGMKDVIRTQSDGYVSAPRDPGLGVEVDWSAMDAATIYALDTRGGR